MARKKERTALERTAGSKTEDTGLSFQHWIGKCWKWHMRKNWSISSLYKGKRSVPLNWLRFLEEGRSFITLWLRTVRWNCRLSGEDGTWGSLSSLSWNCWEGRYFRETELQNPCFSARSMRNNRNTVHRSRVFLYLRVEKFGNYENLSEKGKWFFLKEIENIKISTQHIVHKDFSPPWHGDHHVVFSCRRGDPFDCGSEAVVANNRNYLQQKVRSTTAEWSEVVGLLLF